MRLPVERMYRPLALFLMIAGAATVSLYADEPKPADAESVGEVSEPPERVADEASPGRVAATEADATIAEVEKVSTETDEASPDATESLVYADETKPDEVDREHSPEGRRGRGGGWAWRGHGARGSRHEDGLRTGNRMLDAIFEVVDKDDDGVLSKDEFKEAAKRRFARHRWMRGHGQGRRGAAWVGQHRHRGGRGQWGRRGREGHERRGHWGGNADRLSQLERQIEKLTEAVKELTDDRD